MIFRRIKAILMAVTKTYYGTQGEKFYNPSDNDSLVIAQEDGTSLSGYRTVTTNLSTVCQAVFDIIKNTGGLIYSDGKGLIGSGTVTDPLRVNINYLKKKWVFGSLTNVSQVGNLSDTTLPITAIGSWVLHIGAIRTFLAGRNLNYQDQTVDIRNLTFISGTGKLYLYFRVVSDGLRLIGKTSPIPDQYGVAYIGYCDFNIGGIRSVHSEPFIRLGTYRISTTSMGGAIPATTNTPADVVFTSWGAEGTMW